MIILQRSVRCNRVWLYETCNLRIYKKESKPKDKLMYQDFWSSITTEQVAFTATPTTFFTLFFSKIFSNFQIDYNPALASEKVVKKKTFETKAFA